MFRYVWRGLVMCAIVFNVRRPCRGVEGAEIFNRDSPGSGNVLL